MGGTPPSARIIEDVDRLLKALEIVFCANGAVVEGIADRNKHISKKVSEGTNDRGTVPLMVVRDRRRRGQLCRSISSTGMSVIPS